MSSPMTGNRVGHPAPDIRIRRAVDADARALTRMVRGSGAYEGHYASVVAGLTVGRDYIAAQRVHVAVDADGARLGFYGLLADIAELDLLFVADRAQGLGIGRLLIGHMTAEARRHGLDSVRVVSHPPAEGFYRAMGAERTGTVAPNPPAVAWPRPELRFRIPATP
ncbi:GNAT family N-acetyltransferase [Streptomyces qinzhouensis]|uniref:GNAT family N-acetyltransferase n=1 Tax=Streptomyces qinzhouensis TaxID=2599401 RepID=A0A5B8J0N6_9ACTN|nr:GNAT family N-acetyltransferase [Streptomyces qinzhouensis]QDY75275.1 GNAT family N-acetyltransferase [Streptomyces qinzhouensis]